MNDQVKQDELVEALIYYIDKRGASHKQIVGETLIKCDKSYITKVLQRYIQINDFTAITIVLGCLNIPDNLTFEQRISYYYLMGN